MFPQEFEAAYLAAPDPEDRKTIRLVAADWCEERGELACAACCRSEGPIPLMWCPAGQFRAGEEKKMALLPQGFWLGKYPVTQKQWTQIMQTTISDQQPLAIEQWHQSMGNNIQWEKHSQNWGLPGVGPDYPMYYVSWHEAIEFCDRLTKQESQLKRIPKNWEYVLPTEVQWEYACLAGSSTLFCFGDDETELGEYAWYGENSQNQPHEVGKKKPNAWGFHDMHGNIWEWCRDAWKWDLIVVPNLQTEEQGYSLRATRGGHWEFPAEYCQSSHRSPREPVDRRTYVGFRCALVCTNPTVSNN